jgi:hypothetical protein
VGEEEEELCGLRGGMWMVMGIGVGVLGGFVMECHCGVGDLVLRLGVVGNMLCICISALSIRFFYRFRIYFEVDLPLKLEQSSY